MSCNQNTFLRNYEKKTLANRKNCRLSSLFRTRNSNEDSFALVEVESLYCFDRHVFISRLSRNSVQECLDVTRSENFGWMKSVSRKHLLNMMMNKNDEEAINVRFK